MSWYTSAKNNSDFIKKLKKNNVIKTDLTYQGMFAVDRADYCPFGDPYVDSPQSIGYKVTISAPHMHACAIDLFNKVLKKKKGKVKILDVGSGSGYLCACLAHICCENDGVIYGIEIVPELVKASIANLNKDEKCKKWMKEKKIVIQKGDGWDGLKEEGPFDLIHVGAAPKTIPKSLVSQLEKGGRLVLPVGDYSQQLVTVDKDKDGKTTVTERFGVRYVPLVNPQKKK